MKKFFKIFICALTFVMGFGAALANPTINVVNAIETLSPAPVVNGAKGSFAFDAVKMPSPVNAEEDAEKKGFLIPVPKVSDDSYTIGIVVKNTKNTFKYTIGEEDTTYFVKNGSTGVYFKYNTSSSYQVYYTATKGDEVFTSSIYEVNVTGVSHAFDTKTNKFLPTVASVGDKILIPELSVIDSTDTVVADDSVTIEVIKNGNKIAVSNNGELKETDEKLYLTPSAVGTYTIKYRSTNYNLVADYEIDVLANFNSAKVELQAETLTMDTVEIGKEITFPSAKVTDKAHNFLESIETSTIITIKNAKIKNDKGEFLIVATLPENEYKYTFNATGNYIVEYTIKNLYLNNQKTLNTRIADEVVVEDTTAPVVNFVADYTASGNNWEDSIEILGNHIVPTRVGFNGFTVPAVYASDLGTDYSGLTFERVLEDNSGNVYYIDKPYHETNQPNGNAAISYDANYEADVTKKISFKFGRKENETDDAFKTRVSGNYKLIYKATEKVGANQINRTASKQVSVQVLAVDALSNTEDTNLKFELPTMPDEMNSDEVRKIAVANKPTDDKDTAIETRFYYTFGSKEEVDAIYKASILAGEKYAYDFEKIVKDNNLTYLIHELEYEDGKIVLDFTEATTPLPSSITIIGVAINDQDQCVMDSKVINIKKVTDNATPQLISVGSFDKAEYTLGVDTKINLPTIEFKDLSDKYLSISARYYIDDIKNGLSPVSGGYFTFDDDTLSSYAGAYIEPKQAGRYFVVLSAKDDANNVYDLVSYVDVVKQVNYSIHLDSVTSLDIYDSTEINAYVVDDEGNKCEKDYILTTAEPADWATSYTKYYTKDAGKYEIVDDATAPAWEANKYYEAKNVKVSILFTSTTPDCEGTTYTFNTAGDYTFKAKVNYAGKDLESGIRKIVVNNVSYKWKNEKAISVQTWSRLSPNSNEYSLVASQPTDWATSFTNYFTKNEEKYTAVTGATAPTWEEDKYYKQNDVEFIQLTIPVAVQNTKERLADVKVTNPSGDVVDLIEVVNSEGAISSEFVKFIPDKEGQYTVTYSVESLTKTFKIQVGDNNKPVVTIKDKAKIQKDIVYSGDKLTYKLTYELKNSTKESNIYNVTVKVSNDKKTLSNYTVELELYDLDKDSKKVAMTWNEAFKNSSAIKLNDKTAESSSNNEYSWTISSLGDYNLKLTSTDSKGISSVAETVKFKLVDETDVKDKKDNKVGIILIVISAIVLVGIVCFFAFAGELIKEKY